MISWVKSRFMERSSWDGATIIGVSLVVLFLGPFAKWACYAGLIYGACTLIMKEK